jgi:hypothetical protein
MDVVLVLFLVLRSTEYMISTYQLQTCDLMAMYFLFYFHLLATVELDTLLTGDINGGTATLLLKKVAKTGSSFNM